MNREELLLTLNSSSRYKEIWLQHSSGTSICALINGDIGWLMYLPEDGGAGFSSRNPNETDTVEIEFLLNNGQEDLYPKNWTYPLSILKEGLFSFLKTGQRPTQLEWHNDSM